MLFVNKENVKITISGRMEDVIQNVQKNPKPSLPKLEKLYKLFVNHATLKDVTNVQLTLYHKEKFVTNVKLVNSLTDSNVLCNKSVNQDNIGILKFLTINAVEILTNSTVKLVMEMESQLALLN